MCCWGLIARKTSPNPVPKRPHSGLFGRQRCSKSAGRCRLHIQQIQWSRPTCVTVIFVFIFLSCCLKRVEGHTSLLLFAKQRQQNSCVRSFPWKSCFCWSFLANAKVNRLLETVIVSSLSFIVWSFCSFNKVRSMLYNGKYYPQIWNLFWFFSFLISLTVPLRKTCTLVFNARCNQDKLCVLVFPLKNTWYVLNRHHFTLFFSSPLMTFCLHMVWLEFVY